MAENEQPLDLSTFRTPERRPLRGYKSRTIVRPRNQCDRRQGGGPPSSERRQEGAPHIRQARIPLKVNFFCI